MRKYALAALLGATIATPAFAQEGAPFTGARVEGLLGYDRTDVEGEDSDGILYGVGVGYDFQMGSLVAGIEGEFSDSTVDECIEDLDVIGDELCAKAGRDLYVGGRIGGVVGSNTLLYAKAGYVNGRVGLDYDAPGTVDDFDESENLDGVRVGAGLEFGLGTGMFAKAEYRYSNYESDFAKHQGVVGVGLRF
jgi:outer membrane immunogenic protein